MTEMKGKLVHKVDEHFTKEALQESDGKTVPLRKWPGGPKIGTATMRYDEGQNALVADLTVTDASAEKFLKGNPPSIGGRFIDA